MYKLLSKYILINIISLLLYQSCQSYPKIDFYVVNNNLNQYYIRSSKLIVENNNSIIEIDFTYHNFKSDEKENNVTCNFTLIKKGRILKNVSKSYFILNDEKSNKVYLNNIEVLYRKQFRLKNKTRFTSKIKDSDFKKIVFAEYPKLILEFNNEKRFTFIPSKIFLRQIKGVKMVIYGNEL